jgi:hypothetical protein
LTRLLLCICLFLPYVAARADVVPVTPDQSLEALFRSARPGDAFLLAPGDYVGGVQFSSRPGTALLPITVKAAGAGVRILGSTATRIDGLGFTSSPHWVFDGIAFEGAARSGLKPGSSDYLTVRNCTFRNNGVQGMQAGTSNFGTVEDCLFMFSKEQHGAYVSGAIRGWKFNRCTFAFNGRAGLQFNSQGTGGGVSTGHSVTNCSFFANGQNNEAAAINLIGVTNSVFAGNTLSDNRAGGISFMGNGTATGQSTGNTVYNCSVTFRTLEGRACVQQTGGTLSVTGCRLWAGKEQVSAITSAGGAVVTQAGNLVLAPMPVTTGGHTTVPDDVVAGPVP